jgi:hypothetical protein
LYKDTLASEKRERSSGLRKQLPLICLILLGISGMSTFSLLLFASKASTSAITTNTLNTAIGSNPTETVPMPTVAISPNVSSAISVAGQNWATPSIETPAAKPIVTPYSTGLASLPGNPEDTGKNIHVGLPSVTFIPSGQKLLDANPPVHEVWNWNNGEKGSKYPSIYMGDYFPVDRQPDFRYYKGAEPLSWFQTQHPDWLEYKCDQTTIAYEFGQGTDIPLDTANPAVLSWLETTFYGPAAASGNFKHLDFDNFQMENGGSYSGQRCGHFDTSHRWVQQYTGTSDDPQYRANEIQMASNLQSWLHKSYPNVAFAANFSYDNTYPADSDSLMSHVDLLFDEQGFTNGNNGPPYNYTDAAWVAKARHMWNFIVSGHGWQDINQFGTPFKTLSNAQKQWAIANYLLLKNNASWIYICGYQEYGTLLLTPEYTAPIGSPTDTYYVNQNVYGRDFTNGVVLVNPSSHGSFTVSLSGTYHDLYGHIIGSKLTLAPVSAIILLNG